MSTARRINSRATSNKVPLRGLVAKMCCRTKQSAQADFVWVARDFSRRAVGVEAQREGAKVWM